MFRALPKAKTLIADKGYDSDTFRAALKARGTAASRRAQYPPRK